MDPPTATQRKKLGVTLPDTPVVASVKGKGKERAEEEDNDDDDDAPSPLLANPKTLVSNIQGTDLKIQMKLIEWVIMILDFLDETARDWLDRGYSMIFRCLEWESLRSVADRREVHGVAD